MVLLNDMNYPEGNINEEGRITKLDEVGMAVPKSAQFIGIITSTIIHPYACFF